MKDGQLDPLTKVFTVGETEVNIGLHEFVNKKDGFGLFDTDVEPQTFFSVDQVIEVKSDIR